MYAFLCSKRVIYIHFIWDRLYSLSVADRNTWINLCKWGMYFSAGWLPIISVAWERNKAVWLTHWHSFSFSTLSQSFLFFLCFTLLHKLNVGVRFSPKLAILPFCLQTSVSTSIFVNTTSRQCLHVLWNLPWLYVVI